MGRVDLPLNLKTMNTYIKNFLVLLAGGILALAGSLSTTLFQTAQTFSGISPNNPQMTQASTTVFTLTNSSQRLLATSSQRVAADFDVYNCTATAIGIFTRMSQDKPATTGTGNFIIGSTSDAFGLTPFGPPTVTGAVTGITAAGTCTVAVTEWNNGQ